MPNWCQNSLYIKGSMADLDELEQIIKAGEFFSGIYPEPVALDVDAAAGRDWRITNWGTKWDIDLENTDIKYELNESGEPELILWFDTAWSPPVGVYSKIEEEYPECSLTATYYEGGNSFCGMYENGNEQYFDIDGGSEWVKEKIPSFINEEHRISEDLEELEVIEG